MKNFVIARFGIKNYAQFKNEYDSMKDKICQMGGFKKTYINRNLDSPGELLIVHECEDVDKARKFYQTDEYRCCARRAGVDLDSAQILFVEELERTVELVGSR